MSLKLFTSSGRACGRRIVFAARGIAGSGERARMACKPDSVTARAADGHSSGPAVAGGLGQPTRIARAGEPWGLRPARSLFGLAPGGACHAADVAAGAVGSYPTVSPLPSAEAAGGLFSVALSLGSPRAGVTRRHLSLESGLSSTRCGPRPSGHPRAPYLGSNAPSGQRQRVPRAAAQRPRRRAPVRPARPGPEAQPERREHRRPSRPRARRSRPPPRPRGTPPSPPRRPAPASAQTARPPARQPPPVELRPRIGLPPRRHVGMRDHPGRRDAPSARRSRRAAPPAPPSAARETAGSRRAARRWPARSRSSASSRPQPRPRCPAPACQARSASATSRQTRPSSAIR